MFRIKLRKVRQSREEKVLSMVIRELGIMHRSCNCILDRSGIPNERIRAGFGVEVADALLKAIDRGLAK